MATNGDIIRKALAFYASGQHDNGVEHRIALTALACIEIDRDRYLHLYDNMKERLASAEANLRAKASV